MIVGWRTAYVNAPAFAPREATFSSEASALSILPGALRPAARHCRIAKPSILADCGAAAAAAVCIACAAAAVAASALLNCARVTTPPRMRRRRRPPSCMSAAGSIPNASRSAGGSAPSAASIALSIAPSSSAGASAPSALAASAGSSGPNDSMTDSSHSAFTTAIRAGAVKGAPRPSSSIPIAPFPAIFQSYSFSTNYCVTPAGLPPKGERAWRPSRRHPPAGLHRPCSHGSRRPPLTHSPCDDARSPPSAS